MTMLGQLSIFDELAPVREVKLPFTVVTGPNKWDDEFCAYCGTRRNLNEGGCGPADEVFRSYSYLICNLCSDKYRTMQPPREQWIYKETQ